MPSNAGNVGVDYSFGYYDANTGSMVDLGDIQVIKMTALKHDLKNMRYNGAPKYGFVPDGHHITFTITRTGSDLEKLAVQREVNFNAGTIDKAGYLTKTVTDPDGTTSRFQYTGFVFFLTDHGDVSREKLVTISGEGYASEQITLP